MGNCCRRQNANSYDELVVSGDIGRLDNAVSHQNQSGQAVDEVDITIDVSAPLYSEVDRGGLRYMSHPYLCDENVIRHIQLLKTMFIMRGLPGSGKSTLVKELQQRYPKATVCSADNFWLTPEGQYEFDIERLKEAHEWCRNLAYQACETGKGHVIIDNTNVKRWEFRYYLDIANRFNYLTLLVEPQTPWRFNADVLFQMGVHNVPLDALHAKVKAYQDPPFPFYIGWFTNQITNEKLLKDGKSFLTLVNSDIGLYQRLGFPEDVVLREYFQWNSRLHITSMFCGKGGVPGSREYIHQVRTEFGKLFSFHVYAILITPRVVAAAVGPLTDDVLVLWNNGDDEGLATGAKAHLTLAVAESVPQKQSGEELLQFLKAKEDGSVERWNCDDPLVDLVVATDPEVGCLFQLKKPFDFNAVFNGFY